MLLKKQVKQTKKTVTYRVDRDLLEEFKSLTKKYGYMQITVIENAMREAVKELKEIERKQDEK